MPPIHRANEQNTHNIVNWNQNHVVRHRLLLHFQRYQLTVVRLQKQKTNRLAKCYSTKLLIIILSIYLLQSFLIGLLALIVL